MRLWCFLLFIDVVGNAYTLSPRYPHLCQKPLVNTLLMEGDRPVTGKEMDREKYIQIGDVFVNAYGEPIFIKV